MGFSIPRGGRVGTRHLGRTAATSKNAQHDKLALANAIGRTRWASSHVVLAVVGSAVAIVGAAVMTGLSYGVAADDVGGKLGVVLVAFVAIYFLGLDLHAVHAHAACFWCVVAAYRRGVIGIGPRTFRRRDLCEGSPGRCTHSSQPSNCLFDAGGELVDVGCRIVVGGDPEHDVIGVAENGYACS